jgi:hypothetical protein
MSIIADLKATFNNIFQIGKGGVKLKNNSQNLQIRNSADTEYSDISAKELNLQGVNGDYSISVKKPNALAVNYDFILPPDTGSPSQVLSTDGVGNLSWVDAGNTAPLLKFDTTTIAHDSSSPVTMFTLPANAVVRLVQIIVDSAFDGTPTLSVGITGTLSKYLATTQVDLNEVGSYEVSPTAIASGTTENLIATYSSGGATVGSCRILVAYHTPD